MASKRNKPGSRTRGSRKKQQRLNNLIVEIDDKIKADGMGVKNADELELRPATKTPKNKKIKPPPEPLKDIPELTPARAGKFTFFPTMLSLKEYIEAWDQWVAEARAKGPLTSETFKDFQKEFGEYVDEDGIKWKPTKVNPTSQRAKKGESLKKVRGGEMTGSEGKGFNMRKWRGDLATYIWQGIPETTSQAKGKTDLGDTLEAHHRVGNAELAPWLDDIIEMLKSKNPKIRAQGRAMVEAGRLYFQNHPIKAGNVRQNYELLTKEMHIGSGTPKGEDTHGRLGTGDPARDMGDDPFISPEGRKERGFKGEEITGPGGKSQWIHPKTGEPLPFAQKIRQLPWRKEETMSWVEQGLYKGRKQMFPRKGGPIPDTSRLSRWSTLQDYIETGTPIKQDIIDREIRKNSDLRTEAEIKAGRFGIDVKQADLGNSLHRLNRLLNGSTAAATTRGIRKGQGVTTMALGLEFRDPTTIAFGAGQTALASSPVQKQIAKQASRAAQTQIAEYTAKRLAKYGGQRLTKAIPVVGDLAIGLPELWNYASRGKLKQAGVSAVSTVIGMVPGKGDLAAAALDSWNMYQDISEIRRQIGGL